MRTPRYSSSLWILCFAAIACGDDARIEVPDQPEQDSSPVISGMDREAECDEAPEGTPCGAAGQEKHCIFDACVRNACGDGVRAGSEGCDDGNERNGDGCNERCRAEECGNGVVDSGEACDDGNDDEADECASTCELAEPLPPAADAGNSEEGDAGGVVDAGGDGDGAGVVDAGGDGDGVVDAGGDGDGDGDGDREGITGDVECDACLEELCTNYQDSGFNLIAGCFANPDPTFSQKCADAFYCNLDSDDPCADDITRGAISCYCGAGTDLSGCGTTAGPSGPCIDEWTIAGGCEGMPAGAARWGCVLQAVTNVDVAAGLASFMTQCKDVLCGEVIPAGGSPIPGPCTLD